MPSALLMTSTIAPAPGVFLLARTDPAERLADYQAALAFYAPMVKQGLFDHLVYADNSGHDLATLQAIAAAHGVSDRCEFLSFCTAPQPGVSRYALELALIDEALARSQVLAQPGLAIWKVTGRYIVANLPVIVGSAPESCDLYVNCRNLPSRGLDFYLTRFNRRVFDELLWADRAAFMVPRSGETILRERLDHGWAPGPRITRRFAVTPRLLGRRGWDGARYGGLFDTAKYLVRRGLNRVWPGLWV